jgi:hypothetical protein
MLIFLMDVSGRMGPSRCTTFFTFSAGMSAHVVDEDEKYIVLGISRLGSG